MVLGGHVSLAGKISWKSVKISWSFPYSFPAVFRILNVGCLGQAAHTAARLLQ